MARARDSLFDAVFPLLEGIGTYADCYVTLVAGNAGKDDCDEGFFTAWANFFSLSGHFIADI